MRPCFQAIHNMLFPNSRTKSQLSRDPKSYASGSSPRSQTENKGIVKTVDIELSSRSMSMEDILRSRDRF
jgi:hypothetical protein